MKDLLIESIEQYAKAIDVLDNIEKNIIKCIEMQEMSIKDILDEFMKEYGDILSKCATIIEYPYKNSTLGEYDYDLHQMRNLKDTDLFRNFMMYINDDYFKFHIFCDGYSLDIYINKDSKFNRATFEFSWNDKARCDCSVFCDHINDILENVIKATLYKVESACDNKFDRYDYLCEKFNKLNLSLEKTRTCPICGGKYKIK